MVEEVNKTVVVPSTGKQESSAKVEMKKDSGKPAKVQEPHMNDQAVDDSLLTILNRRDFYRDNFHRSMLINLLMIVANIIFGFLVVYLLFSQQPPKYFVTTPDGRILPITPLNQPLKSTPQVLAWANVAAVTVNSYDFLNFRAQLQAASVNFTPDGFQAYKKVLQDSKNLDFVVKNKLLSTAVATGAPFVLQQGLLSGRYTWKIQLPLLIKYQSASQSTTNPVVVTMLIQRVPLEVNSQGMGVVYYQSQGG